MCPAVNSRARAHVEHDDRAVVEAGGKLLAVDDLDAVAVTEVGGGQLVEPGDVGFGDVAHGRPQLATRSLASA